MIQDLVEHGKSAKAYHDIQVEAQHIRFEIQRPAVAEAEAPLPCAWVGDPYFHTPCPFGDLSRDAAFQSWGRTLGVMAMVGNPVVAISVLALMPVARWYAARDEERWG